MRIGLPIAGPGMPSPLILIHQPINHRWIIVYQVMAADLFLRQPVNNDGSTGSPFPLTIHAAAHCTARMPDSRLMLAQSWENKNLMLISRLALVALICVSVPSCYTLTRKDIFEVAFQPIPAATLVALSDEHHIVERLPVADVRPPLSAYWDHGDSSPSILIFFNGNGYGAERALRRLLIPTRKMGLDLIVFNYYDQGQRVPSMSHVRAAAQALFAAATTLPTPAAKSIFVGGHSLGATFALDTAVNNPVEGVFIAAPATTGVAMIKYQLWYSRFARLLPDEDYRQFDNIALARRLHRKIIVFGS